MSTINNENEYRLTRSKSLAGQRQSLEQQKLKLHHNLVHKSSVQPDENTSSTTTTKNHPSPHKASSSEEVVVTNGNSRQYLADVSNQYGVSGSKEPSSAKPAPVASVSKTDSARPQLAPAPHLISTSEPATSKKTTTTKSTKSTTTTTEKHTRRPLGGDLAPLTQQKSNSLAQHNHSRKETDKENQTKPSAPAKDSSIKPKSNPPSTTNNTSNNLNVTASASKKHHLLIPNRLPQKRQATESSSNLVEKLHITNELNASSLTSSSTITNGPVSANRFKKSKRIDYEWQDLDEEDFDDPLMVSEYVNDIFPYLNELEHRTLPDPQYLFKQAQLKPRMRSILVDWLVEMHQRFRLLPETLFLAINIMDRFMSLEVVQIDKLQLLATGSLFIAAKYEEVFSPSVKNYAYFTDGSYTEEEILQAEKYILTILEFELNYPNPMNFLRRISKADDYDVQSRTLGKYLLEITIMDYKFIGMLPSLCSASAMYIARLILGKDPVWNGNLIHYSGGYKVNDMKECINLIMEYLVAPVEHDEFFKKYATRKFMKASIVCRGWARKFISEEKDLFDPSLLTERITK